MNKFTRFFAVCSDTPVMPTEGEGTICMGMTVEDEIKNHLVNFPKEYDFEVYEVTFRKILVSKGDAKC